MPLIILTDSVISLKLQDNNWHYFLIFFCNFKGFKLCTYIFDAQPSYRLCVESHIKYLVTLKQLQSMETCVVKVFLSASFTLSAGRNSFEMDESRVSPWNSSWWMALWLSCRTLHCYSNVIGMSFDTRAVKHVKLHTLTKY